MNVTIVHTKVAKKSAFTKKRPTKKARKQVDIKIFVNTFYERYGEMMSKLSHE